VDLARLVAAEVGKRARVLPPLPVAALRRLLSGIARIDMARAKRRGRRPLLEYDSVQYFGRDYVYSTDKLKATSFTFEYPYPEEGLRATVRWYRENGWLAASEKKRGR
jgi:hypothetical protein